MVFISPLFEMACDDIKFVGAGQIFPMASSSFVRQHYMVSAKVLISLYRQSPWFLPWIPGVGATNLEIRQAWNLAQTTPSSSTPNHGKPAWQARQLELGEGLQLGTEHPVRQEARHGFAKLSRVHGAAGSRRIARLALRRS